VTEIRNQRGLVSAALVRRGLYALTVIGILATAFELATVRHWLDIEQLIPWVALVVLAIATGLGLLAVCLPMSTHRPFSNWNRITPVSVGLCFVVSGVVLRPGRM